MKSILVVDDDFAMRKGISLMLQSHGFEVFEAESGDDALKILEVQPIDLNILDLFLPGIDGLELSQRINEKYPGSKIIIITAHFEHSRAIEARNIFKENFLEKIAVEHFLLLRINNLLRIKNDTP